LHGLEPKTSLLLEQFVLLNYEL